MTVDEHLLVAEQFPVNEPIIEHLLEQVLLSEQLHPVEDIPPEKQLPTVHQLSVHTELSSANVDEQSQPTLWSQTKL